MLLAVVLALSSAAQPSTLAGEISPYLLTAATDPVRWEPWGAGPFARARRERKPVFLSAGTLSCHACLVADRELFGDSAVAALLNARFVPVKVDHHEHPEVVEAYGAAPFQGSLLVVLGEGGWLIERIDPAALNTAAALVQRAQLVLGRDWRAALPPSPAPPRTPGAKLSKADIESALTTVVRQVLRDGGSGGASSALLLSLEWQRTRNPEIREALRSRLDEIARSRQRDHLAGGFHADLPGPPPRYEKLLWMNALLLRAYAEGHEATGEIFFRQVAEETARFAIREMRDNAGLFWSALSATSEGTAGKYYTWTADEVARALGPDRTAELVKTYTLRDDGLLTLVGSPFAGLGDSGMVLLGRRARRIRPPTDDLAVTGWNGLMIGSLARSGALLGRAAEIEAARRGAEALLLAVGPPERLARCARGGVRRGTALVDDYAYLAEGMLDLHDATREERWRVLAGQLVDQALRRFWTSPGFLDDVRDALPERATGPGERLLSANGTMVGVLLRLAELNGRPQYKRLAREIAEQLREHAVVERTTSETAFRGLSILLSLDVPSSRPLVP